MEEDSTGAPRTDKGAETRRLGLPQSGGLVDRKILCLEASPVRVRVMPKAFTQNVQGLVGNLRHCRDDKVEEPVFGRPSWGIQDLILEG